jgi:Phage tail lysozyme
VSVLDQILSRLQSALGLTPAQAAGVAGNLQVESGFDPSALNRAEGAIGLAQWENGRRTALQRFAAGRGTAETDLGTQIDFLIYELQGPESGALSHLRAASDPASAAAAFDQYYERSAGTSRSQRVADAQAIANGTPSFAGVSSSGGSSTGGSGESLAASLDTGLMTSWAPAAFTIGIKVLGVGAAAGLLIVGAVHTVSK